MISLPYSEELNIGYLSRLFDDTSNCYKFFWFQAILRKLTPEHTRRSYMCKYCDEQTEKASYSDIIEGRVDFGFYGDMLVGLTIIPKRAWL